MLQRIPLTPKMLLITVTVGAVVWGLLDYVQSRKLESIFLAQLTERLDEEALEDRISFDRYIKSHNLSAKLIVSQKKFIDYIEEAEKKGWSSADTVSIRFYRQTPPWFPKRSVLRFLVQPRYAFLLDRHGRVREVYQSQPKPPPASLLQPTEHLQQLIHKENFLTSIEGTLYLATSESVREPQSSVLATLMLASPVDEEFLNSSQSATTHKGYVVLLSGGESRILVSDTPDLLPAGTTLESLEDTYLITGKAYFDYGAADQFIGFASLLPRTEVKLLSKAILSTERQQRAIAAIILILSFLQIMFWVTQHIQRLSKNVLDFSQNILGVKSKQAGSGDELKVLENQFRNLTEEIISSRNAMIKKAEELQVSEKRYRTVAETASDVIITIDEESRILYANSAVKKIFGYSVPELLGKQLTMLMPDGLRDAHRTALKIYLKTGRKNLPSWRGVEVQGLHKNGKEIPLQASFTGYISDGKHFFTGILRDFTKRKFIEETLLKRSQQLEVLSKAGRHINTVLKVPVILRTLVTLAMDLAGARSGTAGLLNDKNMVFTEYNDNGNLLPVDYTFEQGFGIPGRIIKNRTPYISNNAVNDPHVNPEIRKLFGFYNLINIPILSRNGDLLGCLEIHNTKDKRPFTANDTTMLQGLTATCTVALENAQLLQEREKTERDLKESAEKLARSNQELQDFAYIASHDLQAPLRKVMTFGEKLKEKSRDVLGEQGLDYLQRMQNAAARMQTLINNLLDFSRVTTRAKPLVSVELSSLVQEVLSDLEVQVEQVNGRVEVGDLPAIDADPVQMRQLFQNLIGNALKFHKKDEPPVVKINAQWVNEQGPDKYGDSSSDGLCRITVEDNGIGFEEKYADRIFNVFQRLHGHNEYDGTGIGLSICRKIAERHDGHITVKSRPGQGTVFTVTLYVTQPSGGKVYAGKNNG